MLSEALSLSHRIAVMNHGNVEQIDQPSRIYGFPKNRFVAGFIGKTNMMDAQVLETTSSHLKLILSGLGEMTVPGKEGIHVGDKGAIAIRPEQVQILPYSEEVKVKGCFCGKVHDYLYSGDVTSYIVELVNGTRIESLLPNSTTGTSQIF